MRTHHTCTVARSFAAIACTTALALVPSLARADHDVCHVGQTAFEDREACAVTEKLLSGKPVAFRPFEVMGLINDICEALEGRMDERVRNDPRKTLFRTIDGFDCYQKGEPIRLPPMRDAYFVRPPLILAQATRRR